MKSSDREFDIILLGATGFTGRRAAKYLKNHSSPALNWAIAGRNIDKLKELAKELDIPSEKCFQVNTLEKTETDQISTKTRIILTTVGPYSLYGEQIIASCAEHGTHYLDITGEVGFIKQMADKYGELAKKNKSILVPFSGFDSVPAELCVLLLSKRFTPDDEVYIKSYYSLKGGLNGGTIATMMNKFETGEYKMMGNPRLAMDSTDQELAEATDRNFFGFDTTINRWSTPFIMSSINSKVVYRTSDIMLRMKTPYFKKIAYSEHASLGKWYNPIPFLSTLFILILIQSLSPFSWFRKLLLLFAPAPGEGPSENSIENGYFKVQSFANSKSGKKEKLTCSFSGDPSNKATVFFLCESALTLVEQLDSVTNVPKTFGFLTPATAFGDILVERLKTNGYMIK